MVRRSFRRANLISPFGPGAISVTTDGASLMTAGLDAWFPASDSLQQNEFQFGEWRLQKQLSVDHFFQPPDFRKTMNSSSRLGEGSANMNLTIPVLRFPTWFHCTDQSCGRLQRRSLTTSDFPKCSDCAKRMGRHSSMTQVQFIALCEQGHIQDFPWNEWVHRSHTPDCLGKLRLKGSGSSSLAGRYVTCDLCGSRRNLGRILEGAQVGSEHDSTSQQVDNLSFVSRSLDKDGIPYLCQGHRPWLGDDKGQSCTSPLTGSLRGATNVYYPVVRSAVYVPSNDERLPKGLIEILETGTVRGTLSLFKQSIESGLPLAKQVRQIHKNILNSFTDEQVLAGIEFLDNPPTREPKSNDDTEETGFRRLEFITLRKGLDHQNLLVREGDLSAYDKITQRFFSRVNLIERLTETRVFNGFSRVKPIDSISNEARDQLIWKTEPRYGQRWLPAYQVYGEGLFLEFDEQEIKRWEQRTDVLERAADLNQRVGDLRKQRGLEEKPITPRFLLIHTTAHLLINQLVFSSGYSSASLRERLYASDDSQNPMAGMLIYTASGDSDGTLGGLVRMGGPATLGTTLLDAVQSASWCSGDPVCMERGSSGGQGPDSCNLAACHSCSLLPETSCEEFNRYLDRWMLVGDSNNPDSGFFSKLLQIDTATDL